MNPDREPSPRYESYLLRLRWVERDGRPTCQAMLQSVATKEQRYFADLERLMAYLKERAQVTALETDIPGKTPLPLKEGSDNTQTFDADVGTLTTFKVSPAQP